MSATDSLKQRLRGGDKLTGCWASLANNLTAEIMANAGYDAVMIDMEHGPTSFTEAIGLIQAVTPAGAKSLIRVSSANIVDIKRALDIGPHGIMVPDVRNTEQATEVVRNTRYAPAGNRGAAPGYMRACNYAGLLPAHPAVTGYPEFMKEEFLLMMQIESAEAVDNIDAICEVEGIDMLFVGPADLSASLGKLGDFTSTQFIDAMTKIESAANKNSISLGTIVFPGWDAARLYKQHYQLVLSGADGLLLAQAAAQDHALLESSKS